MPHIDNQPLDLTASRMTDGAWVASSSMHSWDSIPVIAFSGNYGYRPSGEPVYVVDRNGSKVHSSTWPREWVVPGRPSVENDPLISIFANAQAPKHCFKFPASALCALLRRVERRIAVARRAKRSQWRDHRASRFRIPSTTRTFTSNKLKSLSAPSLWQRFRRQSTSCHHNERWIFCSFARYWRRVNTFCIQ